MSPRRPACDADAPSARSCHLPDSFRPCRSSRLRRFAPPGTFQVSCTLKPILGFARLQVFGACLLDLVRWSPTEAVVRLHLVAVVPERTPTPTLPVRWVPARPKTSRVHPFRRGELEFSSNRSHWRSTLRSFPLAFSRSASTASHVRAPRGLRTRETRASQPCGTLVVHGLRATTELAFPSLVLASAGVVLRKRSDAAPGPIPRPQGLDPSASPLRASALQLASARCSLGLRPSKVCSNDAVPVRVRGSRQPESPLAPRRCRDTFAPRHRRVASPKRRYIGPSAQTVRAICVDRWSRGPATGEPVVIHSIADQPPSVQFREQQAACGPADPTNTCSRRSAAPEGMAPDATSSGLPSSFLPGDRAPSSWRGPS
jgi:hypothetical protein